MPDVHVQRFLNPAIGSLSIVNSLLEAQPQYASKLFGDRLPIASEYVRILARDSDRLGLLGPREFPKIWSRHVAHCALLSELVGEQEPTRSANIGDVLDLGSGAGLPGIPLAIALPQRRFTLLEPMERRADWLRRTSVELGLENVEVARERAEEHRLTHHIVTARAVAPLRKLVVLAAPLLATDPGSALMFIKGKSAAAEIEDAAKAVQRAKLAPPELFILGRELQAEPLTVVRMARIQ